MELRSVENPKNPAIRVALNRIRHCPAAITDKQEVVVSPAITAEESMKKPEDAEDSPGEVCDHQFTNEECNAAQLETGWMNRLRPLNPRTAAS